jgi:hypothetical protein
MMAATLDQSAIAHIATYWRTRFVSEQDAAERHRFSQYGALCLYLASRGEA